MLLDAYIRTNSILFAGLNNVIPTLYYLFAKIRQRLLNFGDQNFGQFFRQISYSSFCLIQMFEFRMRLEELDLRRADAQLRDGQSIKSHLGTILR